MSNPFIYSINEPGKLLWYQHLGAARGEFTWNGPKEVGTGWHSFKKVFSGGGGVIYAIDQNHDLHWYRHTGYADGSFTWEGPVKVGNGWNFTHVFAANNGVIYAVEPLGLDPVTGQRTGGHLLWFRHVGRNIGSSDWLGPNRVGNGWHIFDHVFSGGNGVIYGIKADGDLMWYLHQGREEGSFRWIDGKKVGNGWGFQYVFSGGDGIIYAVEHTKLDPQTGRITGGNLQWYQHLGHQDGTRQWAAPRQVGKSWRNFIQVFSGGYGVTGEIPGLPRQCGVPDPTGGGIHITSYGSPGGKWDQGNLTYSINLSGSGLPAAFVNGVIAGAFAQWRAASPYFTFTQVTGNANINIQFGGKTLNEGFGAPGGTLAVGYYPQDGRLQFDSSENWTVPNKLLAVALHEIGHVLGLSHSNVRTSIMYPYDLSLVALDTETQNAIRSLYGWRPQISLGDRGSTEGPSLAVGGRFSLIGGGLGELFKVWRGVSGDSAVYWSALNGTTWSPQQRISGIGTAHGPALATGFTTTPPDGVPVTGLFMAWSGAPGDSNIYYSQSRNLGSWDSQQVVNGVGTSDRPALCMFNGKMIMAWKGAPGDSGLYWASFDGNGWSGQRVIRGRGSSHGPALAVLGNRLYMFWKGVANDSHVYYAWMDDQPGAIWQSQQIVTYTNSQAEGNINQAIGSSYRPAATTRGNSIILAWKGVEGDSRIYFSTFQDNEFSGQIRVAGVGTSSGPGLSTLNNRLHMAWRGIQGDSGLYYSWLG